MSLTMTSEPRKSSPTQQPVGSSAAPTKPTSSSSASPFPTTSPTENGSTQAPSFFSSLRNMSGPQPAFPLGMGANNTFDRDYSKPIGTPFASSPAPSMIRVLIRRLPLNTSEESLRLMVMWSKELVDVELLSPDKSEDNGFRSGIIRFRSMAGALEAKNMLDGRANISNDAEMIVEILSTSPIGPRHSVADAGPRPQQQQHQHQQQQHAHFNGNYHGHERISPTSNGAFPAHEFPKPDAHYQKIFSSHSPIGGHLPVDRSRMTGKALINNDFADDDETSDLLKDPVAYAETSHRRATAPQIPIGRMANLTLNTANSPPGPSSLPPYVVSMSPVNASIPAMAFPPPGSQGVVSNGAGNGNSNVPSGNGFPRHNFPPVNPADQNPPCNTLYVGNLPIDTSEEELKAMFSKQRGYKRLCFRTKQNGPMCFVEFEDISFATKALHELYGQPLHNSVKGGIRLSFSKNPLGVRSGQTPAQVSPMAMANMNGYPSAAGPPPGLGAPPGLGTGRANYNLNGNGHRGYPLPTFPAGQNNPWSPSIYNNGVVAGPNGGLNSNSNFMPRHMMGR